MPARFLNAMALGIAARARKLTLGERPRQTRRALAVLLGLGLGIGLGAPAGAASPDGTYEQGCQAGYQRAEILDGENAIYVEKNFADAKCRELSLEIRSHGRVEFGAAVKDPPGARIVDFIFQRVTLTPKQEWVAKLYRERNLCGIGDWKLGQDAEITGRACDFFGAGRFAQVPEAGDTRYGIYRFDEEGRLYFGKLRPERDGLTPERRPRELDPFPYLKR